MPVCASEWLPFWAIFILFIGILCSYLSNDFKIEIFRWQPPPRYENELRRNKALANEEILMKGDIFGPESIVVEGDIFFVGTSDGKFMRVEKDGLKKKILPTNLKPSAILGLRRWNKNFFIAIDMFNGIFIVNFDTDEIKIILPTNTNINGQKILFPNDLDVFDEDTIFFTDSCSKWGHLKFSYCVLEGSRSGKVYKYQIPTQTLEIILDNLFCANGIQILPDQNAFLVSEMCAARVTKYYFSGPKQGQREIFADNLPGYPDNIRLSHNQQILYVPMGGVRHPEMNSYVEMLGTWPNFRKIFLQTLPVKWLNSWISNQLFSIKYGLILEFALNGTLLRSLHDPCGVAHKISQVTDDGKSLYIGSFELDFIVKVNKTEMEKKLEQNEDSNL